MLSALPKVGWSETQYLSFYKARNRVAHYIDCQEAFPEERNDSQKRDHDILPSDPEELVAEAVKIS